MALGLIAAIFGACEGRPENGDGAFSSSSRTAATSTTTAAPTATSPTGARPTCNVPIPAAQPETTEIRVYFYCGGNGVSDDPLIPVVRRVPQTAAVLQAVIEAWLRGPTPEESTAGFSNGVLEEASQSRATVTLRDGVALVAIDHELNSIGNFTTSNITGAFYRLLHANAFQFEGVEAVAVTGQCPGEVECEETPDGPRTYPARRSDWEGREVPCPSPSPAGSLCPTS